MKFSKKAKALVLAAVIAVSGVAPAHAVDLAGSGASFVVPLVEAEQVRTTLITKSEISGFQIQLTQEQRSAQQYFTHQSLQLLLQY